MRKHYKNLILELISTLKEANVELKKLYIAKNMAVLSTLLSDCQEIAAQILDIIEQLEGEDVKTCNYIVEYYELLYRASLEFDDNRHIIGLENQVRKIEKSVNKDIKSDKIEIIFLPYKASMFDSMESIWLAAKDDPQCDAYVIPIPYYDKLPDGSLGQIYYEGEKYPDYVPVIDWKSYNIEERRPDAIVIHNPYDNNNYVTSVHPDFYACKLKEFTNMLVYTPYFVGEGGNIQEHFCTLPGTLFSDLVIVQSEKIRELYIQYFKKFEKENNCAGRFGDAKKKFVALGSPKFDKVINSKPEDYSIPDEWEKLVSKPDGTRKKVVLYNTTIAGLLRGNEKVIFKLLDTFEKFKALDDVVLLWRPHPLNVSTCKSMLPRLFRSYLNIVEDYKRQNFGIYDESADLNRAIAISDAYYGDLSSLVPLFQCAGKPIMIQDFDIFLPNENAYSLTFTDFYDDGENYWFAGSNLNGLFKMDKQTWKPEFMGSFPNEPATVKNLYRTIAKVNEKLYFTPGRANEIAIYDIKNNKFDKVAFARKTNKARFFSAIAYKNHVFFTNLFYPGMIRLDTNDNSLDYFADCNKLIEGETAKGDGIYFRNVYAVKNMLYMSAYNTNVVVAFNMDNCTTSVYRLGEKGISFSAACYDGEYLWLAPRNREIIIKWEPCTQNYKEYKNFPVGFKIGKHGFANIIYLNRYVWLFPREANVVLKLDINTESITIADKFQEGCNYLFSKCIDEDIYAFAGKTNQFVKYNVKSNWQRKEKILISEEEINGIKQEQLKLLSSYYLESLTLTDYRFNENLLFKIQDLSEVIADESEYIGDISKKQIDIIERLNINADGSCGPKTYAYIKSEVL